MAGDQDGKEQNANQQQQGGETKDSAQQQNGNASGQQGGSQQGATSEKTFTQDDVNRLIDERLNRAKAKWDKDVEDAKKKQAEKELPELERLKAELKREQDEKSALAAKTREADARESVRDLAKRAGAPEDSLSAVYRMVKADIEYDDDGKPTNIEALMTDAKKIAPALFRPAVGRGDAGAGSGARAAAGDKDWMRAGVRSLRGGS